MTPIKLELRHWCQHEAREFIFTRGMNSLSGPNGSGKSTMIDALRLCLSLESGNHGKLTDNIQDGHERGSLVLEFEHGGVRGLVRIQLRRNYSKNWDEFSLEQEAAQAQVRAREENPQLQVNESTLKLASFNPKEEMKVEMVYGEKTMTKVGEIREWYRTTLGLDPRVVSASYFPVQGDVDGALSGDKETRQRVFHEKAGTALCQKIWDLLGRELRSIPDLTQDRDRAQELSARLARAQAEHQDWSERLQCARIRLPNVTGMAQELERLRLSQEQQQRLVEMQARRSGLLQQVQDLERRKESLTQEGVALAAQLAPRAAEVERVSVLLADQARLISQQNERAVLLAEEQELVGVLRAIDEESRQHPHPDGLDQLVLQSGAILSEIKSAEHYLQHFSSGVCPTCSQVVADAKDRVADLSVRLPQLRRDLAVAEDRLRHATRSVREFEDWASDKQKRHSSVSVALAGVQSSLVRVPEPQGILSQEELASYSVLVENHNADQGRLVGLRARYTSVESELGKHLHLLGDLEEQIAQGVRSMVTAPTAERVREIESALGLRLSAEQEVRDLETEVEVKRRYLADVSTDFSTAQDKAKAAEPLSRWKWLVEQARELLHRDALPAQLVAWYADQLVRHTQTYLQMFDAGFELFVARDLTLMATFADKTQPVSRLSGGQKNMLNISMRLAMVDMFPSELRLLVLDEVEVHLDQHNVARLPVVLEKVKGLARGRDLVVLFVSHHPSLSGVADHVIHMEA